MSASRFTTIIISCCFASGIWLFGQGTYIYLKAHLAQYMLHSAWEETLASQENIKPWPWADMWPVARLIYRQQNIDLIVLAGDSGRTLAFGPGYQFGSSAPGDAGNSLISAHRDTHFAFLEHIQLNDEVLVQTRRNKTIKYIVREVGVIDSRSNTIPLDFESSVITLLTCYPFQQLNDNTPYRFKVVLEAEQGALENHNKYDSEVSI